MKDCFKEVKAIADFLDPTRNSNFDAENLLPGFDDQSLSTIIKHNKVIIQFQERLQKTPNPATTFFKSHPQTQSLISNMQDKAQTDWVAFSNISRKLSQSGVSIILIKSDGTFPYESDNIDVLVKPTMFSRVVGLLKSGGYTEFPSVREPHKYLFRNKTSYDVLPLHIHLQVEWEGTRFVDSANLWSRCISTEGESPFCYPSPEDCILITVAHLFFENHEIKLADLLKVESKLRNNPIDWDYMFDHVERLHWKDAFSLTMQMLNLIYQNLYGKGLLENKVLQRMKTGNFYLVDSVFEILKPMCSRIAPFKIPYAVSAFFFVKRVIQESEMTFPKRLNHLSWIAGDITKRRYDKTH